MQIILNVVNLQFYDTKTELQLGNQIFLEKVVGDLHIDKCYRSSMHAHIYTTVHLLLMDLKALSQSGSPRSSGTLSRNPSFILTDVILVSVDHRRENYSSFCLFTVL